MTEDSGQRSGEPGRRSIFWTTEDITSVYPVKPFLLVFIWGLLALSLPKGCAENNRMPTIKRFEDLECWQEARKLVRLIYTLTKKPEFSRDFKLVDQIRDSAGSSMANTSPVG